MVKPFRSRQTVKHIVLIGTGLLMLVILLLALTNERSAAAASSSIWKAPERTANGVHWPALPLPTRGSMCANSPFPRRVGAAGCGCAFGQGFPGFEPREAVIFEILGKNRLARAGIEQGVEGGQLGWRRRFDALQSH